MHENTGLRERKKAETRQSIRSAVLLLDSLEHVLGNVAAHLGKRPGSASAPTGVLRSGLQPGGDSAA